jgi:hypothetical protein
MALQKAYFKNLETGDNYQVQFNPTELSLSKSAQFAEITIPGLDAPVQQFVHGGAETLRVELFFDETDKGMAEDATSITERTDAFYSLVKQNRETHAPPRCLFVWGPPTFTSILEATSDLVDALNELSEAAELDTERLNLANSWDSWAPYWFVCIVESVERQFLLFSPEGIPIRARLTLSLKEYQTVDRMVARLRSADHTKARIFERQQRLDQIASREYRNPAEWRRIAEANDVDDPRRITPGTVLQVPPLQTPALRRRASS